MFRGINKYEILYVSHFHLNIKLLTTINISNRTKHTTTKHIYLPCTLEPHTPILTTNNTTTHTMDYHTQHNHKQHNHTHHNHTHHNQADLPNIQRQPT